MKDVPGKTSGKKGNTEGIRTKSTAIPSRIVDMWQGIVDSISVFLSVPSVMINRLEPPELEVFRSNLGPENPFRSGMRMEMAGIYCEAAAKRRKMVQVKDARKDPAWADSPTARAGIFAYLGFPLFWPDGDVFGTICAVDTRDHEWGKKYSDVLAAFKNGIEAHLALVTAMEELNRKNLELQSALGEVKALRGLLPICSICKKVRDDKGYWDQIETYIEKHSDAQFTHGICPDCVRNFYPEVNG
jgi:hypothetical protein